MRQSPASAARERAAEYLIQRHYFSWPEALPWLIAIACFFIFPDRMTFGSQVLIMVIFALSLDLILGYAGIVTLGHAAFFGIGAYTVALGFVKLGWSEPITRHHRRRHRLRPCRHRRRLVHPALSRADAVDAYDRLCRDAAGVRQYPLGPHRRL